MSSVYTLRAKYFLGNISYLQFISFLHTDMTQVVYIPPHKISTYLFYIVNIMGTDVLAIQGARASATMILTMLNRNNLVPAR